MIDDFWHFFTDYTAAFQARDFERLATFWDYPSMFSWETDVLPLRTPAQLIIAANRLSAYYDRAGRATLEKDVLDVRMASETTAIVRTAERMLREDQSLIGAWEYVYVVRKVNGKWKIVAAIGDDEAKYLRSQNADVF
jgi:hypothetical protein